MGFQETAGSEAVDHTVQHGSQDIDAEGLRNHKLPKFLRLVFK